MKPIQRVKLEIIELEYNNYHIIAPCTLANGEKSWWIVDTGASKTVFDIAKIDLYEKEENPPLEKYKSAGINDTIAETKLGILPSLKFGELEIKDISVALISLEHINQIYLQFCPYSITGLLGSDLLFKHQATIDYKKQEMLLF